MALRRVVVGRVGRAHGIHGLVSVDVRTDEPEERFAVGAVLQTDRGSELTVLDARMHSGRLLLAFESVEDRSSAEALRGTELLVDVDSAATPSDTDEWYDHQLVGLSALDPTGASLGVVREVVHLPMHDLLAVETPSGAEVLVPFVAAVVTDVDVENQSLRLSPPGGLFDEE